MNLKDKCIPMMNELHSEFLVGVWDAKNIKSNYMSKQTITSRIRAINCVISHVLK